MPKSKYHESAGAIAVPVTEDTSYTISLASRNLAQEPKVAQKMASFIVEPEPIKKSATTSPGRLLDLIMCAINSLGFSHGCLPG